MKNRGTMFCGECKWYGKLRLFRCMNPQFKVWEKTYEKEGFVHPWADGVNVDNNCEGFEESLGKKIGNLWKAFEKG